VKTKIEIESEAGAKIIISHKDRKFFIKTENDNKNFSGYDMCRIAKAIKYFYENTTLIT